MAQRTPQARKKELAATLADLRREESRRMATLAGKMGEGFRAREERRLRETREDIQTVMAKLRQLEREG